MLVVYQSRNQILVTTKEMEAEFLESKFDDLSKIAEFQREEITSDDKGVTIDLHVSMNYYSEY